MQEFNVKNKALFKEQLEEIERKYRSNIQYFIYKSIILRNLYGVDIMHEATEIARLRLFLKMVAVVDVDRRADNLGLDPLPDIDFNIRCGNTLVGYATQQELDQDLTYGDIFANMEFKEKVEQEMQKVAMAYKRFKEIQFTQHEGMVAFKQAKSELCNRLEILNDELNLRLYAATIVDRDKEERYKKWLNDYKPFHWLAEFYEIIQQNGGFDVIIGNPPYVEYSKIRKIYLLKNFTVQECGNLFGFVIERVKNLISVNGYFSFIVPISVVCTQRMESIQKYIFSSNEVWLSNYGERPSKLFTGAEVLLTIFIVSPKRILSDHRTTTFIKWKADERPILFEKLFYNKVFVKPKKYVIPKIGFDIENNILNKIKISNKSLVHDLLKESPHKIFYRIGGGRYWKVFTDFRPKFILNGEESISSRENYLYAKSEIEKKAIISILSSSLFYWYFILTTNCRDLNPSDLKEFPIFISDLDLINLRFLSNLCDDLMIDYKDNSLSKEKISGKTGNITYQEFYPRLSKNIIDEIDKVLAKHYGFTEEELDFIINYDIKYRMGSELNGEE